MPTNVEEIMKILYPNQDAMSDKDKKSYAKNVAFLEKYFDKFSDTCELYADRRSLFSEIDFNRIILDMTKDRFDPETIVSKYLDGMLEFMKENGIITDEFDAFMDLLYFERRKENEYKDVPLDKTPIALDTVFTLTEEFLGGVDESGELLAEFIKLKDEDRIEVQSPDSGAKSIYQNNKVQYVFDGTVNTANTLVHEFMHHWCEVKAQTSMDRTNYTTVREFLSIYYENAFIRFMDDKGILKHGERPLLADRLQKDFDKDPNDCLLTMLELAHKKMVEGDIDKDGMMEIFKVHASKEDINPEELWENETKKIIDFSDEHIFAMEVITGFSAYRFSTGLVHYTSLAPDKVKSIFKLAEYIKDGEHDPIFLQEYLKAIGQEELTFPLEETPDLAGANRGEKVVPMISVDSIAKRVVPATNLEDKNFVSKIFGRWKEKFFERTGESRDDK